MKDIVYFDIESTGVDVMRDEIIDIFFLKKTGKSQLVSLKLRVKPSFPIPPSSTDVHGIDDEMVKDAPSFKEVAPEIVKFISGCDLCGFNSNAFDIPLLYIQLSKVPNIDLSVFDDMENIDVGVLFKRKEERTLSAAVKFYLNRDHTDAHEADADVYATRDVLRAMMLKYDDLKDMNRSELSLYSSYDKKKPDIQGKFTIDEDGDYVFEFGKHKGEKARNNPSFLSWMLSKDFLPDTKNICQKVLHDCNM